MSSIVKYSIVILGFFASIVNAAPNVYTLPPTTLSDSSSIAGTFTYDPVTGVHSSINLVQTGGSASTFNVVGVTNAGLYIRGSAASSGPTPGIYIVISSFPSVSLGIGECGAGAFGANGCINVSSLGSGYVTGSNTVTYVAATPASIPTLGEWAMIFLASLIAMFGIRRMRRK